MSKINLKVNGPLNQRGKRARYAATLCPPQ